MNESTLEQQYKSSEGYILISHQHITICWALDCRLDKRNKFKLFSFHIFIDSLYIVSGSPTGSHLKTILMALYFSIAECRVF